MSCVVENNKKQEVIEDDVKIELDEIDKRILEEDKELWLELADM